MLKVKDLWYYIQQPNRVLPKYVYIYLQTWQHTQTCVGKIDDLEEILLSPYFIKNFGNSEVIEVSFDMKNEDNNYISILIKGSLGSNNYKEKK